MLEKIYTTCHTNYGLIRKITLEFSKQNSELITTIPIGAASIPLSFTVDTGAQISLIKTKNLLKDTLVMKQEKVILMGIANGTPTETLGKIYTCLTINGKKLNFGFQVTDIPINLSTDGIIGSDLLSKFNATINYANNTIEFETEKPQAQTTIAQTENEYEKAIKEYTDQMKLSQNDCTLSFLRETQIEKPVKNKNFYENMECEYFQNYPNEVTAKIISTQSEFVKILQTRIEENSWQ